MKIESFTGGIFDTNCYLIEHQNQTILIDAPQESADWLAQENKKVNALKRDYLNSKTNLITAPQQVEVSFKNYLTYTKGDDAYNDYRDKELLLKLYEQSKKIKNLPELVRFASRLINFFEIYILR